MMISEDDYYEKTKKLIEALSYKDCLILLREALVTYPNYYDFYRMSGACHAYLFQFETALHFYEIFFSKSPRIVKEHYLERGRLYFETGSQDAAINDYKKYIEEDGNLARAHSLIGDAYLKKAMYEEAIIHHLRAVEIDSKWADAYNGLGIAYFNLKRYNDAIEVLNECIILSPKHNHAYANRALNKVELGNFSAAIQDYDISIEIDSENPVAYYGKGTALQKNDMIKEALLAYDKALMLKPDFAYCWMHKGVCCHALEKIGEAKICFYRAYYFQSGTYENFLEFYKRHRIAPFFIMRIISNEISPAFYDKCADLIIDTFDTCSSLYTFILWKSLKKDVSFSASEWTKWLSFINYYMGDCLITFDILSKQILEGSQDLMSFYYLLLSCGQFEEDESIYLEKSLDIIKQINFSEQPAILTEDRIIKYYYAAQILIYDRQDDEAMNFLNFISDKFLPAAYLTLYVLHEKNDSEKEINKVAAFIEKKERFLGQEKGYAFGLKKHTLDLEKDSLRSPFARYFHYQEISSGIDIFVEMCSEKENSFVETEYAYTQDSFYELFLIKKEDLDKTLIKTYIEPLLQEWETNLFNFQTANSEVDISEKQRYLVEQNRKLKTAFREVLESVETNGQENAMALCLEEYELSLPDYTELLSYFFLKGHFTPYEKMVLHFYILYREIYEKSISNSHKAGVKDLIKNVISTGIIATPIIVGGGYPLQLTLAASFSLSIFASYAKGRFSETFMQFLNLTDKKLIEYEQFKNEFEVFVGKERKRLGKDFYDVYPIDEL